MKKLVLMFSLATASLGLAQEKTIKFQADIQNLSGNVIEIWGPMDFLQEIKGDSKGHFETSFPIKEDNLYWLNAGDNNISLIYMKGGDDLKVKADFNNFLQTITFAGTRANENNFLAKRDRQRFQRESLNKSIIELEDANFNKEFADKTAKELYAIEKSKFDSKFVELLKEQMAEEGQQIKDSHSNYLLLKKLNNTMSVSFDYKNHAGGTTKLEDFKGKYVYIDVWATWCGPCVQEIPSLKKVEEKYHNKKIVFVSISVDDAKDFEKWKTFVTEQQLAGVQLFSNKSWEDNFMKTYGVKGIPRFILIDPTGKIINPDAPRPSEPDLELLLDSLIG
jgi:thiol-disulfide isomerase/thioredoxin